MLVWSAVRTALVFDPYSSVSLRSCAYWSLVSAGGGGARNWDVLSNMNGCKDAIQGVCAICVDPAVFGSDHKPACSGPMPKTGVGSLRPSVARRASRSEAAARPTLIPLAVALSFGRAEIEASYFAVSVPT